MANIPSGNSQYDIVDSNKVYVLGAAAHRNVSGENGIFASDMVEHDKIIIKGDINQLGSGFAGIWTDGADMTIHIEQGGSVKGVKGIYSESFETSNKLQIINEGLLQGSNYAIQTFDSKEVVTNHGTMKGKIDLGSNDDVFDNRGGHVDHQIGGGTGDDTLIVDNAATKLFENGGSSGYDTVKSTVSYTLSQNVERLILLGNNNSHGTGNNDQSDLYGNSGNNVLSALGGVDKLDGGKGNDLLKGGANADMFFFKTGYDHDTIADFENGLDTIDLQKFNAVTSYNDLKAHHLTFSHGDAIIEAGGDQLVIKNYTKADLDSSDFLIS